VALIARYTGWSEHFIIWDLPLVKAYAYAHAFMRMNNINTKLLINSINESENFAVLFDKSFPQAQ
jgi:hypothetical protein